MRKLVLAGIALIAAASVSQSQESAKPDLKCENNKSDDNSKKICEIIYKLVKELDNSTAPKKTDPEWAGLFGINIEFGDDFYRYAIIPGEPAKILATTTCNVRGKPWISAYPITSNTFLAFCDEGPGTNLSGVVHLDKATLRAGKFEPTVVGNVKCSEAFVPKAVKDNATCK